MSNYSSSKIKIGSLTLENKFFLAPLTKVTDLPFRLLVKQYRPGLMYTEMIDAKNLAKEKKNVVYKVRTLEYEQPVGLQLFGTQESFYATAIKKFEDKFSLFDLNLGCPTNEAISQGAGVILLRRPQKMVKIIESMVNATSKPVTVKLRLGLTDTSNFFKTLHQIEQAGADAVCVHARLANDSYKVPNNWDLIKKAKEELNIPVIGNGDIFNGILANKYIDEQYADAIMIGRSAMHNPKIFSDCLTNSISEITEEERWNWIQQFYANAVEVNFLRLIRLRKRISDFLHPFLNLSDRKMLRNEKLKMSFDEINDFLKDRFQKEIEPIKPVSI